MAILNYSLNVRRIHEASMRLMAEAGVKFVSEEAREILKANGIRVEGDLAFFTEEQLMYWVRKAPSTFKIYGKDPKWDMTIGGDHVNPAPSYGAPFISEQDGTRRVGDIEDYIKFVKLYEQDRNFKMNGGVICQPGDLPAGSATALMFYATYTHSNKCMFTGCGTKEEIQDMFKMAEAAYGSKEELIKYPRFTTIIDTITPLTLDKHMFDTMKIFVEYGQPVIVASCAMGSTTAPVTMGGPIAYTNCEVLATIALAQMIHPGVGCMYGSQSTTADLRNGAIASGSPEGAIIYKYCTEMAKFYGLPSRGGGALSDAKVVDAQAGYESMLSYLTCAQNNMNLIVHAAGIMDGYQSISYEKMILDFQIIESANRYLRDTYIDDQDEAIPVDLMVEIGHDGTYLAEDHTIEHCREEVMVPFLSVCGQCSDPVNQFNTNIKNKMNQYLNSYKKPEINPDVLAKMREILIGRGVDPALLDKIENA